MLLGHKGPVYLRPRFIGAVGPRPTYYLSIYLSPHHAMLHSCFTNQHYYDINTTYKSNCNFKNTVFASATPGINWREREKTYSGLSHLYGCDNVSLGIWHSITFHTTWILKKTAMDTWNLACHTSRIFGEKIQGKKDRTFHSVCWKMLTLCKTFQELFWVHSHQNNLDTTECIFSRKSYWAWTFQTP
jgi:hypothetical protein